MHFLLNLIINVILFSMSLLSIFSKWNNLVSLLLVMEFMVIVLVLKLYFLFYTKVLVLIFLFIGVLEAIMGLILVILLVRYFGNDCFNSFFW